MKTKNTIFLAILLIALGAYVYFYEIKGGEKRKAAEERASKVFLVEKDSINSLILKPSNIHLQKVGESWKIVEPIEYETEKYVVNNILSSLTNAEKERTIAEKPSDYQAYGIRDSSLQIVFKHSGQSDTLVLGDKNPTGSFVFARKGGSAEIFLTSTSLLYNAQKSLFDLRDKTVLSFDTPEVNKVNLKIGAKSFAASKQEETWMIEQPAEYKGDQSTFDRILNKIKNSRVKEFVDENPTKLSPYGLQNPKITIDLYLGENNAKKTLMFGKEKDDQYFAKDESRRPVFLVDSTLFNTFNNLTLFDLRDKQINNFKPSDANHIEFEKADTKILCEKDTSGNWQIIVPELKAARNWKISNILETLKNLKAEGFVTPKPNKEEEWGFTNPRGKIVVMNNDNILASVIVGKEIDDKTYVKNLLSGQAYLVRKTDGNSLVVGLTDIAETEAESKANKNDEEDKE